jgi:hypothetical protein
LAEPLVAENRRFAKQSHFSGPAKKDHFAKQSHFPAGRTDDGIPLINYAFGRNILDY